MIFARRAVAFSREKQLLAKQAELFHQRPFSSAIDGLKPKMNSWASLLLNLVFAARRVELNRVGSSLWSLRSRWVWVGSAAVEMNGPLGRNDAVSSLNSRL